MRLLYTSDADLSRPSAERTHITEIVNGLAAEGFTVHLTALMRRPYPTFHEAVELHGILPIINRIPFAIISERVQRFQATRMVESILVKKRIEVAYERQGCDLALAPAKRLGIPIVIEINGVPSLESAVHLTNDERRKIDEDWVGAFKSADAIVAVSSGIKDCLIDMGVDGTRIRVITNGVNTEVFHPIDRKECRKVVGIPENARVAIFVGNFRPYHNLELLVRSVGRIARQIPEFLLVLVGDSIGQGGLVHHPTIEDLNGIAREEGVQSRIRFVGRQSQLAIPFYINAADVGVSLANRPGISKANAVSPIKNSEYMACGLAVVCTAATENASDLQKEMAGIVVELDEDHVAGAIVDLLADDRLREQMGAMALTMAKSRYTWQMKSRETAKLLRDIVDHTS